MRKTFLTVLAITTSLLLSTSRVNAYPEELPVNGDGKLNSMAMAGSAVVSGGSAVAVNPAGLANTKEISANLAGNLMLLSLQAPANGPMTESSSFSVAPLFYLGAGFRLHEMIVVGLNAYLPAGSGATYENIDYSDFNIPGFTGMEPKDWSGTLMIMEMGPAIAFNFPYDIKLGAGYRINYFSQSFDGYSAESLTGTVMVVDNDMGLDGWGYTGFRVGIQWDPIEVFHVGVAYRSEVEADLEGSNNMAATTPLGELELDFDVSTTETYADKLSFGLGYDPIPKKLTLVFDYELDMYEPRNEQYTVVAKSAELQQLIGQEEMTKEVEEHPDNRHTFRLGAEYWVLEPLAIRAGVAYQTQAKKVDYHNPNSGGAPAGYILGAIGGGYQVIDTLRIDLAYNFVYSGGDVPQNLDNPTGFAVPGDYMAMANHISLGVELITE
jgi:long-subunit fatty acid transport protein